MTDLATLSATEARRLIGRRALSPVELTEACLARVEALNPVVNAVVAMNADQMRAEAKASEARVMSGAPLGALEGLPFGVKDMINVTGLPTTFGSLVHRDNIATNDDPMVAAMRAAGGVVLGKTNNPEFSLGGNTRNAVYGATGNPHDPTKNAAGSSGGSAAALACGMAPLCTGSDTGGSLRNPAAFCGVVGFRPSPGVVPGQGRAVGLFHFSTSGPMARTVEDIGLMLSVVRGISLLSTHLDPVRANPEAYGPNMRANIAEGLSFTAEDIARALTDQTSYYRRWQAFFEDHDFILSPAVTISPRDWHELYPTEVDGQPTQSYYQWLSLAYASTLAGHPSITLPVGRDETGMPFGLQIIGRRNEDAKLLAFARTIEAICADIPDLAFPQIDAARLSSSRKVSEMSGFMGFEA